MAQIFPRWTNEIPAISVAGLAVGAVLSVYVVWYWFSPSHTDVGYKPTQPIPYSHALHAGTLAIDCRYCHYNVERSAYAGVPPTQVCMNCHRQVKKDSPLLEPLRQSWEQGTPIPWKRIHKAPDYVYFNHSAHVQVGFGDNQAAIGCATCHGRVDWMEVVRQEQPLSMSWCLSCHDNPAPYLRPRGELTNMAWRSDDEEWRMKARHIAKTLHPPGSRTRARTWVEDEHGNYRLETRATAGCNGCHR
jgi:hypothetical protein